ncbi:hypothetical protein SNEBB_003086 [Seison nebaliae]|nr:hypothetical protein SNEBB_003086 [Seison nebaliae]
MKRSSDSEFLQLPSFPHLSSHSIKSKFSKHSSFFTGNSSSVTSSADDPDQFSHQPLLTSSDYQREGKNLIHYISNYLTTIRDKRVFPNVEPGYLRELLPNQAPVQGESWQKIMDDFDQFIMPGITHWQSPYNHAYFPALNSYASLLGDMLADAINCLGFTWAASPACTELEIIVMDWLGKMIGLPDIFLHEKSTTTGGGIIQTTASDAMFVSVLAARSEIINELRKSNFGMTTSEINGKLVSYCSDQAHCSVEKSNLIALVKLRLLKSDDRSLSLKRETLQEAIDEDRRNGLIPFHVVCTLGTTGACAFDDLYGIGQICEKEGLWLHVDAAYAGAAFICPELREPMRGIEKCDSFAFNPSKWLLVHFDCTAMWVANSNLLHKAFNVQPIYLRHHKTGCAIDYMHWQVPLSRRFRSLKLWTVLRTFGIEGLQNHIRSSIQLAEYFESLVRQDSRFIMPFKRNLGLVVFALKVGNFWTELLLRSMNRSGKVHVVPASLSGIFVIRFTITSQFTTRNDIYRDWRIISELATTVLSSMSVFNDCKCRQLKSCQSSTSIYSISSSSSTTIKKGNSKKWKSLRELNSIKHDKQPQSSLVLYNVIKERKKSLQNDIDNQSEIINCSFVGTCHPLPNTFDITDEMGDYRRGRKKFQNAVQKIFKTIRVTKTFREQL